MKRTTHLLALLAVLLLPAVPLRAQTAQPFKAVAHSLRYGVKCDGFGFADRNVDEFVSIGNGVPNTFFTPLIKLPDVGETKITHISFYAENPDSRAGRVVILSDENTPEVLYTQPHAIKRGLNKVALTTPFATEAGKRYYAGFTTRSSTEEDSYCVPFDGIAKASIEDANYCYFSTAGLNKGDRIGGREFVNFLSDEGSMFGALMIFVSLEDYSKLQNMAYLISALGSFELLKPGAQAPVGLTIRNIGMNDIASVETSWQFGTAEAERISQTLAPALPGGESAQFKLTVPADTEGMGVMTLSISKVNGQDNLWAPYGKKFPYSIRDNDAIDRETFLLERFTSEECHVCPMADPDIDALMDKIKQSGRRVSYIAHHSGFISDFLALPEDKELLQYFYLDYEYPSTERMSRQRARHFFTRYLRRLRTNSLYPSVQKNKG